MALRRMAAASSSSSRSGIFFCTDVEGDLDWFRGLMQRSRNIVRLVPVSGSSSSSSSNSGPSLGPTDTDRLEFTEEYRETGHFVFGGDSVDKQPGDLRFVRLLLDFKARHPNQVHWVLGNRDLNKLRFFCELHADPDNQDSLPALNQVSQRCYWDKAVWDPDQDKEQEKPWDYPVFIREAGLENHWVSVLKWMLRCTMGSPDLFENRRTELALVRNVRREQVSDNDVYLSFRNSVNPALPAADSQNGADAGAAAPDHRLGAWMLDFIEAGNFALRLGDYLFVHGAITPLNLGWVPEAVDRAQNLDEWLTRLNDWFRGQVAAYRKNPEHNQGYKLLMDYVATARPSDYHSGIPDYHHAGRSASVAQWFDRNDEVQPVPETVAKFLDEAGIRWAITGHKPHGDCPTIIRSSMPGLPRFQGALDCDTSYSDPGKSKRQADFVVELHPEHMHVCGRLGTLGDDRLHAYTLRWTAADEAAACGELQSNILGRQLPHHQDVPENWRGAWTKTLVRSWDGSTDVVVVKAHKWTVNQIHLPIERVRQLLELA